MKMIWKFLKFITGLFFIFGIFGFAPLILHVFLNSLNKFPSLFISFLMGAFIFYAIWLIYLSKGGSFWSTLEHELTHLFFALIFFKKVHSISASRKRGGAIAIEGGNVVIALSPYFFPLIPTFILGIKLVSPPEIQLYLNFLLGFTYFFHIISLFREIHPRQSDLMQSGYVFSSIVILFFNLFFLGLFLSGLSGEWHDISQFLANGYRETEAHIIETYLIVDHFR